MLTCGILQSTTLTPASRPSNWCLRGRRWGDRQKPRRFVSVVDDGATRPRRGTLLDDLENKGVVTHEDGVLIDYDRIENRCVKPCRRAIGFLAPVVGVAACGEAPRKEDTGQAGVPEGALSEALQLVEQQVAATKSDELGACVSQCTQPLRDGFAALQDLEQARKAIDEMFACAKECFEEAALAGDSNATERLSCSGSATWNGTEYRIECTNGSCSCKKNGAEVMTCDLSGSSCFVSVSSKSGVSAGCCNFAGAPNPPPPAPPPPVGSSCKARGTHQGSSYEIDCTNGDCACKKDDVQVMTCQMAAGEPCRISVSQAGVTAGCCAFSGQPNPPPPPPPPPPPAGSSCKARGTHQGSSYEIDCTNGDCACKKDDVQVMTCQMAAGEPCRISVSQAGVTAGCCAFSGQPDPPPPPPPPPPPAGGSCSAKGAYQGVTYEIGCTSGNCVCKKDDVQVMTCQMGAGERCRISVSQAGVTAACCQF